MNRSLRVAVAFLLAIALSVVTLSCGKSEVSVRSGLRVLCKYNHVLKDTTREVIVPADRVRDYRIIEETTVCAAHLRAEKLFAQAQQAVKAKNTARAKALFGRVVAIDTTFRDAASQYKKLGGKVPAKGAVATNGGSSGGTGTGGGSGSGGGKKPTPTDTTYLGRIPKQLSGYRLVSENEDALSGTRQFTGKDGRPARGLTITVLWVGKRLTFDQWYRKYVGAQYSEGAKRIQVGGATGRFGTDGQDFALLAWPQQGLVFQVEASTRSGSPSALEREVARIARGI